MADNGAMVSIPTKNSTLADGRAKCMTVVAQNPAQAIMDKRTNKFLSVRSWFKES
jgi:hypothetical protein